MITSSRLSATVWSMALVVAAILFSFALACGMPFAGLGALAALIFPWRDALLMAFLGWLANQIIGFGFLGYPTDATTLAWGLALGASALGAVAAAKVAIKTRIQRSFAFSATLVFAAALLAQQAIVYATSWLLPAHPSAFSLPVLWEISWTNALAFAVLGGLYLLGRKSGLAPRADQFAG